MVQDAFLMSHLVVTLAGMTITTLLAYAIYGRVSAATWGWVASLLPDAPVFLLVALGAEKLENVVIVTHSLGIAFIPAFLAIVDLLMLEFNLVRALSWLRWPGFMRAVHKLDLMLEKLEEYRLIPYPERIEMVLAVGALATVVHLLLTICMGNFF
jgi:hypothetical protein